MLGDLAKLYSAVQSAQDREQEIEREERFNVAVEDHIKDLFKPDSKFPKGRRTLGRIKYALAVFDDNPGQLQHHLVRVGAKRVSGRGDEELWELSRNAGEGDTIAKDDPEIRSPRNSKSIWDWPNVVVKRIKYVVVKRIKYVVVKRIKFLTAIIIAMTLIAAVLGSRNELCNFGILEFLCENIAVFTNKELQDLQKLLVELREVNETWSKQF